MEEENKCRSTTRKLGTLLWQHSVGEREKKRRAGTATGWGWVGASISMRREGVAASRLREATGSYDMARATDQRDTMTRTNRTSGQLAQADLTLTVAIWCTPAHASTFGHNTPLMPGAAAASTGHPPSCAWRQPGPTSITGRTILPTQVPDPTPGRANSLWLRLSHGT